MSLAKKIAKRGNKSTKEARKGIKEIRKSAKHTKRGIQREWTKNNPHLKMSKYKAGKKKK